MNGQDCHWFENRIIFFPLQDHGENTSNLGRKRELQVLGWIAANENPGDGLRQLNVYQTEQGT
jgi:hypothetical protein